MHKYLRRGLQATLLVGAGGVLFAAQASASESTNGSQSLLGGNQITAPVTAPVTVAGNAVSALGSNAVAHTASSAPSSGSTSGSPGSQQSTSGPQSIGGGNQVNAPVYAPVTVSGNAVAVGGSNAKTASGHTAPSGGSSSSSQDTSGRQSIGGGNQVNAPVYAPVTVSGNALAALGSNAKAVSNPAPVAGPGTAPGGVSQRTAGSQSVLGGNQVNAPLTAPVTVSGNALA